MQNSHTPQASSPVKDGQHTRSGSAISQIRRKQGIADWSKRILLLVIAAGMLMLAYTTYQDRTSKLENQAIVQMLNDLQAQEVRAIQVIPGGLFQQFEIELKNGKKYLTRGPHLETADLQRYASSGVQIEWKKAELDWRMAPSVITSLLILALIGYMGYESLGASFMRTASRSHTGFDDVAGNEEAKSALNEVVQYLKDPRMYENMGAKFPKGIIMDGPPGTGKTLLAKAVAGQAQANFIAVSGSDFSSMFVGVSSMKVRSIFNRARKNAPCVLFIDEIDALGGHRLSEGTATAREMSSTLNSMLVMMDGFEENAGVVVVAATNRIELLDAALLRSGRFDRHIHLQLPSLSEREAILRLHSARVKMGEVDFGQVARSCAGMSGADLENLINQAALIAVQDKSETIGTASLMAARDRLTMGDPRLGLARDLSQDGKRLLAMHESGHAIAAMAFSSAQVSRVSILPRGKSLGQTMLESSEENLLFTADEILNRVRVLLGGRAAEIMGAHTATTGASDDLARASTMCLDFVGRYGMSAGRLISVSERSSETLRAQIEEEANKLMTSSLEQVIGVLQLNADTFQAMTQELMELEEIGSDRLRHYKSQIRMQA